MRYGYLCLIVAALTLSLAEAQQGSTTQKAGQKTTTQKSGQSSNKTTASQTTQKATPAKSTPPALPALPDPNQVVATVNGEPIRAGELVRAAYDWYGATAIEEMILMRIIEQEARKQQVTVKPQEVEARYNQQLQNAEANLPPGMSLDDFLRRNQFPPSRLYARVRVQLLAEKLAERRVKLDDFVEYSQIVIRIQGNNPEEQENNATAAEAKAQEAYQKISEGLDFAEAAKQYSDDPFSKDRGGKMNWQQKRFMVPDIRAQVEKLKPGQVSPPFRTLAGYMIIKLERTGSQAQGEELEQIRQQAVQIELGEYIRELQSKAKITNTIVKPLSPEQMAGPPQRPAPRAPAARPPQAPRQPTPDQQEQKPQQPPAQPEVRP
jgi:parvulin-like peptidyl-prolyl isomerase